MVRAPGREARLNPNGSFDVWRTEVRGRSKPWLECELDFASRLGRAILEVVVQRSREMARLNQDLSRSNRELEEFVYTASHDLKSPLRGIATYVQMVLPTSGDELTGKARERIQSIVQLANRMDGTPAFLRRSRRKRASQFPHRTSCCAIMRGKDKPPLIETTVLLRRRRLCSHTCVRILVITNAPVCSRHFDAALSTGKTAPAAAPAIQSKAPAHCSRLRCR